MCVLNLPPLGDVLGYGQGQLLVEWSSQHLLAWHISRQLAITGRGGLSENRLSCGITTLACGVDSYASYNCPSRVRRTGK